MLVEVLRSDAPLNFQIGPYGRQVITKARIRKEWRKTGDEPAGQNGALSGAGDLKPFVNGPDDLCKVKILLALPGTRGRHAHSRGELGRERAIVGHVLVPGRGQEPEAGLDVCPALPVGDRLKGGSGGVSGSGTTRARVQQYEHVPELAPAKDPHEILGGERGRGTILFARVPAQQVVPVMFFYYAMACEVEHENVVARELGIRAPQAELVLDLGRALVLAKAGEGRRVAEPAPLFAHCGNIASYTGQLSCLRKVAVTTYAQPDKEAPSNVLTHDRYVTTRCSGRGPPDLNKMTCLQDDNRFNGQSHASRARLGKAARKLDTNVQKLTDGNRRVAFADVIPF